MHFAFCILFIQQVVGLCDLFAVFIIHPADTAADVAHLLVVEAVRGGSEFFGGDGFFTAGAHEHHPVTYAGLGDIGHIHHGLIHAHTAQNFGGFSVDQHMEIVRQASAVAIGIAHGNGGDHSGFFRHEGATVADAVTRLQKLYIADGGLPLHAGWGVKDCLPAVQAFAENLQAELVASRKMVDNGLLPYPMQVGLTGKTVSPPVYIAIGVSGAVHHIAGMERAGTVIAINPDRDAPIFEYADYGILEVFPG